MRLTSGAALGPYEISGPIGAGGMGEVYRARDTRLGRMVALKVLPTEVTRNADRLARFEREARSLSSLNHPNIVTVHDVGVAGDDTYLVMELVQGESLRDLLSRGPVPLRKLLPIAAGIASGLAAAHDAGIVHRDLKPENVMITSEGTAKILDFGLVKTAAPASGDSVTEMKVTNTGMVLGTATYMAPEQARGDRVGIECDQFALGLILYEMATGKHPFRRDNSYETVTAILNEEPPPLDDSFPEPFTWVVQRCLKKDPSERYASTTDLAREINALRDRASSSTTTARTAVPAATSRRWAWVAAAALALVAIAALIAFATRRQADGIAAPLHFDLATPEIDVATGEVAVPVALSPDGRQIVTFGRGMNGANELWLYDLGTRASRLIAASGFGPAWSHDGKAIAFFAEGKLKTVPAAGGPETIVCDASPEGTPSWYGDTILFVRYSGGPAHAGLYRVSAAGGAPERIVAMHSSAGRPRLPWWPHFLPGGKRFLYLIVGGVTDHELMLGSLDGQAPQSVARISSRVAFANGHLLYVRDGALMAQPFDVEARRLTGEPTRLVDRIHYFRNTATSAFSVSENGALAWRSAQHPTRLTWVDRAGVDVGTIATDLFGLDGRLSRDGNRYATGVVDAKLGGSDIWLYDLIRETAERLTSEAADQKAPVWAIDGESIYHRSDGNFGPPDIFQFHPASGTHTEIHRGPAVEHPEDLSSDGKWLLFTTLVHITSDIHALPLDPPGEPRPIAVTAFNETSPRFSPDGQWVAYSSDVSGRSEVYVRPFERAGAAMRISRAGGVRPRWSGDGTELFFLGPAGQVMSVPFNGTFGAPRMLFQNASAVSFEPHPNGNRFLVHLNERRNETPLHVLINWPALVQR